MARLRSNQFPEIRRTILERAAQVFAEVGYATSTITDLTNATKISRGALYHYFPSKEALLQQILGEHLSGFLDILDQALQSRDTPINRFRAVTKAIVEYNTRSRNEQVLVLNEINQLSESERDRLKGMERQIVKKISALIMEVDIAGKVTRLNKSVYTMMYLGIVNYTFAWYDVNGAVKPGEYAERASSLFLNGLQGAIAPPDHDRGPVRKAATGHPHN